jgi:pimeloyl-ACP methyl ester carboxylesterase
MIDEEAKDGVRANAEPGLADVRAPVARRHTADVATVAVSTLVIAGKRKPAGPGSAAGVLAAALPDARFVELDGSGHVTDLEKPDEFAAAVAAFAAEIQIDRHTASTGARRPASRPVTAPPRR